MSADLTMDDNEGPPGRPATEPVVSTRLPPFGSRPAPSAAPAKPHQLTSSNAKPAPAKPVQHTSADPKPAFAATPPNSRKRGPQEPLSNTNTKCRRSKVEDVRSEVEDLSIDALGFDEPTKPRNKRRESYEESDCDDDSSDDAFEGSLDFRFTAVCGYDTKGEVADNYASEELKDCVAALWERIDLVQNTWEEASGDDWQWDFKKARKASAPVCVTQKCRKKGTEWGKGPAGKYACVDCVRLGKPCFTFVLGGDEAASKGDFRLLPLNAKDRAKDVTEGTETRYWINDGKAVVDADNKLQF